MMDLFHADRKDLIAMIVALQGEIADLRRQYDAMAQKCAEQQGVIRALLEQTGEPETDVPGVGGTPKRMPGLKPEQAEEKAPKPRQPRSQGYGRKRMRATRQEVHALRQCPDCGAPLAGGTIKRSREVIEIPPPRVVVTEHVYVERRCPDCGRRCVPAPELTGVVMGHSRFGNRLVSLVMLLREEAALPFGMIQRVLQTTAGLEISVGALVGLVQRVAHVAQPAVAALREAIRASPVVHADETGWRQDGHNGYVWTFGGLNGWLFVPGNRSREVLTATVGPAAAGVLVSDFYAVYTGYEGMHQYCWAHLLRDIKELAAQHPGVRNWAAAVQEVFQRAQSGTHGDTRHRWAVRTEAETTLRHLCEPWQHTDAPQTTLCQRIVKHLSSLFVFVTEPGVPPTNNAAERSLRHLVVSRKISGGTRSALGTQAKMTLASLFTTWRAQGIDPYTACYELLATPQI